MKHILRTDAELDNCIYFQTIVEVWINGELEEQGVVESFTDLTVKINGYYFFRTNCTLTKRRVYW